MDKLTRKVTEDKSIPGKKKKVKLNVLKYGLKKRSNSDNKLNETSKDNHTKSYSKEDLIDAFPGHENVETPSPKKGKKDKKSTYEPKSYKTSSFISKLKLGKLISSPSKTQRGEAKSVQATKRESSNILSSDTNIASTSLKQATLVAVTYDTYIDQEKTSEINMSDTNKQSGEGETNERDLPEKTSDNIVTTLQQASTSLFSKIAWRSTEEPIETKTAEDTENKTGQQEEKTKKRLSKGKISTDKLKITDVEEIKPNNNKIEYLSVKTTDNTTDANETAATSSANLSNEKTHSEVIEDNKVKETNASSADMPAFSDLIMDGTQEHPKNTSNVTPFGGEKREHLYKLLVIGELGTGKTSIIKRYVHQFFSQHYRATIGVDFALKVLNWDANTIIRLQLWDIAGQERFGNMTRVYYKDAVGAFIVFDATRVATFDAVVKWKQDLDSKVQLPDGSPIPCVLLGNKCDQPKEGMVNSPNKMEEYCKEKGFAGWFETSAKENINIEEGAKFLVSKILLNDKLLCNKDANKDNERISIDGKGGNNKYKSDNIKSCSC